MERDATRQGTTVIVPTRNRPAALARTLADLVPSLREVGASEVVVVDDGSVPAVSLPQMVTGLESRVVRLAGAGRSAARNAGAAAARGETLIFLDDDMSVEPGFVRAHRQAHGTNADALCVGSVRLEPEVLLTPFGRFRQRLEDAIVERARTGPVPANFCTSANMSLAHERWQRLGGFDCSLESAEDQDLALRHTACGGRILFLPDAAAVHRDSIVDLRGYLRRTEWGAKHMVPFCLKHPSLPDNVERARVNGETVLGAEPLRVTLKKTAKRLLGLPPVLGGLLGIIALLERARPQSTSLARCYGMLVGVSLMKGYRDGLRAYGRLLR